MVVMSAYPVERPLPPRVNGRHQDKALARARKTRAIELRMQGMTYQQIADEMGYKNAGSVYTIIKAAQERQLGAAVEDYRETELARLDALQEALWPAAMAGDVSAVEATLKVIESRCRLLGLSGRRRGTAARCVQPPTVVLRTTGCAEPSCPVHGRV
jgi:transposase-like protein